jgi:undecaprenyl-diphosphatase
MRRIERSPVQDLFSAGCAQRARPHVAERDACPVDASGRALTEFLPVSSSAHLILASWLAGWQDQGLVLDVAVHLGTLLAVVFYFRTTLLEMALALLLPARYPELDAQRRLAVQVALASIPVLLAGWLAYDLVAGLLRDVRVLAWATIGFGLLLLLVDRLARSDRGLPDLHLPGAVAIGLAQVLALVPGASRSGVTMTMGRALGLGADAAARFSFLLSIPVIGAAGGHGVLRVAQGQGAVQWGDFLLAAGIAAAAGWLCINVFLALLSRVGLLPFIIYRLLLGIVLLSLV